jgi:hypothetical protein
MSRFRFALAPVVATALLFLGAVNTSAAPVNSHSPNLMMLPVSCDNGMSFTAVVPGSSSMNSKNVDAAHLLGSTGIFATKSLSVTITEGGQVVFSSVINHAENASFQGSIVTCQGSRPITDPFNGLPATLTVVAQGFITPR